MEGIISEVVDMLRATDEILERIKHSFAMREAMRARNNPMYLGYHLMEHRRVSRWTSDGMRAFLGIDWEQWDSLCSCYTKRQDRDLNEYSVELAGQVCIESMKLFILLHAVFGNLPKA